MFGSVRGQCPNMEKWSEIVGCVIREPPVRPQTSITGYRVGRENGEVRLQATDIRVQYTLRLCTLLYGTIPFLNQNTLIISSRAPVFAYRQQPPDNYRVLYLLGFVRNY